MKIKNFLENFILVAIILVIIHTFIFELAAYLHWSVNTRNILIFLGLAFDLIFSIEFTARSIAGARKNKQSLYRYWFYERGWVDFLSSLPLLLLDSGPSVYFLLSSGLHDGGAAIGTLNVLKIVKAVRVTRILRLVRIIKIFGKIHNAESKMAQHHTSSISTTAVFTIITVLIGFSVFFDSTGSKKIDLRKKTYNTRLDNISLLKHKDNYKKLITKLFDKDDYIIKIMVKDKILIENIDEPFFKKYYEFEDYIKVKKLDYTFFISIADIHKEVALDHIKSFMIIVLLVLSFMFIYTKHFVQNVADIIHILNKGFRKKDYNLQIKIRDEFADQEIFRLAKFYNDHYLPAKLKQLKNKEENKESGLTMNDLINFK
jgi:ion transport protein